MVDGIEERTRDVATVVRILHRDETSLTFRVDETTADRLRALAATP